MKMLFVCMGAFLALGMLCACGSTNETADGGTAATALVAFTDSGCKKDQAAALTAGLGVARHALLTVDGTLYDGLTCISWDATGDTLKIDCLNFGGGCSVPWQGTALAGEGNALKLLARHDYIFYGGMPGCAGAACGSCIYDWSYDVKGIDPARDCPLTLQSGPPCDKERDYSLTLPLSTTKKGIACRYTSYSLLTWGGEKMGTLHNPCGLTAEEQVRIPACEEGLVCTNMGVEYSEDVNICLKACSADADCPLDGLLKCDGGVCVLKETW